MIKERKGRGHFVDWVQTKFKLTISGIKRCLIFGRLILFIVVTFVMSSVRSVIETRS